MKTILVAIVAAIAIAGCSESSDEPRAEREREREDIETVFDPLVNNIDKAKQVEQQVLDQKKKMDDAIGQAEGDPQ